MVNLEDYRSLFFVGSLVLVLVVAIPALSLLIPFSVEGEHFSEFYVLGPGHIAEDYPFNVEEGGKYSVYLGVDNHMASSIFYNVQVKFRNQNEPPPNSTTGTPSPLPTLYEYNIFLEDESNWETLLTFSFSGISFSGNYCKVESLVINGFKFDMNKSVLWDEDHNGYYYQLFFELWIYQVESETFEFHNRVVDIWLKMKDF